MSVVVYIDIYFIVNFSMDFLILAIVSKLQKERIRIVRTIFASILGALIGCLILRWGLKFPVVSVLACYVVAPMLMLMIVFGRLGFGRLITLILYQYTVTIMLGGLLNCIFYNLSLGRYLRKIFGVTGQHAVSIGMLMVTVGGLLLCLPYLVRSFMRFQKRNTHIYSVSLELDGKWVDAKGLVDTGNHLREPISNKPVIIAERSLINQIMDKELLEYTTRIRVIPYHSIGKEHGTMYALVIDELDVLGADEVHQYKNVVTGVYEGTLSSKKDYQLILHEEFL